MSEATTPVDVELAKLTSEVKSLKDCVAGLSPVLEGLRSDVKQIQIEQAGFVATAKSNDENLDARVSRVETKNDWWNVINTVGAVIAGVIGVKT
jgi:hypothetical protein